MLHQPGGNLNPVTSPWPFAQWGLDIIRPFHRASGNRQYVIVATDYFMKWVEAEALANIRDVDMKKFMWKTSLRDSEFPEHWCPTTNYSLIVSSFTNIVAALG